MTDTPDALIDGRDLAFAAVNAVVGVEPSTELLETYYAADKALRARLTAGDAAIKRVAELENMHAGYVQLVNANQAASDAVLAAMRKGGVLEGWQLVPKVPTREMSAAIAELDWNSKEDVTWQQGYGAMLAAAPQPPALDRDAEEHMAQSIYESWAFHGGDPKKPAWVSGGNSNRQTEARALAQAAIRAMKVQT